jgi:Cd2+/Zn2+-exporting ATPase
MPMENIQYKVQLEGLNCADCALKIENKIKAQQTIEDVHLNFVNKTIAYEVKAGTDVDHFSIVKEIVQYFEPHVQVKQQTEQQVNEGVQKKVFILNGLVCANCAQKIENKLQNFEQIDEAIIDFNTQKLIVKGTNLESQTKKIKTLVEKIEPDVKVVEQAQSNQLTTQRSIDYNFKMLARIIVAFGIFMFAIFSNVSNVQLPLYVLAYLIIGYDIVFKAFKDVTNGQLFDENFLMTIATFGAFGIQEYPEAVAVMLFYQFGEYLQSLAVNQSRKSIAELMDIKPDYANLLIGGQLRKVNPDDVSIGDRIQVKPGEKVPLDGTIIEGKASFDTVALTGESVPRSLSQGDEVLSGYINTNGLITVEVTNTLENSTVAKILALVENSSAKKADTEKFITKFAKYYTPAVVLAAALIVIIPVLAFNQPFDMWLYRALVFLVISCPCALVVSIPLGFFSGIGRASRSGILIKGGNYLEALKGVTKVIFDKTGTLTEGVFKVQAIERNNDYTEEEILSYAAAVEKFSNHPIAKSIVEASPMTEDDYQVKGYEEISGKGVKAVVQDQEILVGNEKLLNAHNIIFDPAEIESTVIYIAINNDYAGYITIADQIKADAFQTISRLKALGITDVTMLTGDNGTIAKSIAKKLGIKQYYAELLPQDKVELMESIEANKQKNEKIAFIGDGINDAPVIKRADVGIAMGALGSDAAIEAADVVILNDEPSRVVDALNISKFTNKIVWQNIIFALGTKGIVMLLGAIGYASIQAAVFADVGVALIAILNSLRILNYQ